MLYLVPGRAGRKGKNTFPIYRTCAATCHGKWRDNFTKYCSCHEKWLDPDQKLCKTKNATLASPNIAPATNSEWSSNFCDSYDLILALALPFCFQGAEGTRLIFLDADHLFFFIKFFFWCLFLLKVGCQEIPNIETISDLNLVRHVGAAIVGITAPIDSKFPSRIPRANSPHLRHCVSSNVAWTPRWDSKVLGMIRNHYMR